MSEEAVFGLENAVQAREVAMLGKDYPGPVQVMAFSPDGTLLACSTYDRLYLWDVQHKKLLFEDENLARDLAFHPDGQTLAVVGRNVRFLELPSGEQRSALKGHPGGTNGVVYSSDGRFFASGGGDGIVRIGNLETRRLAQQFEHDAPVQALAFSADDRLLGVISWGEEDLPHQFYLWNLDNGEKRTIFCGSEKHLSFSPDSSLFALDGKIYRVDNLHAIHDFNEREAIFSPTSPLIVTCRSDFTTIGLWDADSGDKLGVLKGHQDPIWSIAFSPDGTRLASGSGSLGLSARDTERAPVGCPAARSRAYA